MGHFGMIQLDFFTDRRKGNAGKGTKKGHARASPGSFEHVRYGCGQQKPPTGYPKF